MLGLLNGGLELGVQSVFGGATAWVSDIDKGACKILAHRFPGVPNIGDMTAVDWAAVEPVDLICGGTPCQDLSHAGRRRGMTEGTRSNLWVAMREAIAVIRPRYVVWENVRGAASAEADSDLVNDPRLLAGVRRRPGQPVLRALGRVVGDLSDLGYVGQVRGLRAADVGAPHGRFRYFILATDARAAADADDRRRGEPDPRLRGIPVPNENGGGTLLPTPRATDGTKGGPNQRGSSGDLMSPSAVHLLGTPRASEWKGCGPVGSKSHDHRLAHDYLDAQVLSIEAQRLLPTPTSQAAKHGSDDRGPGSLDDHNLWSVAARLLPTPRVTQPGYADDGRGGKSLDVDAAIARWETLTRPAPPPTEPSAKGTPRLSAAFSEWMMGLPAGWVTDVPGITRNEALKALGNGVVPAQAAAALREMARWEVAA